MTITYQEHIDTVTSFWSGRLSRAQFEYANIRMEIYDKLPREELLRRAYLNGALSGLDLEEEIIIARNNMHDIEEVVNLLIDVLKNNNYTFQYIENVDMEKYQTSVRILREWLEPKISSWLKINGITYCDVFVHIL